MDQHMNCKRGDRRLHLETEYLTLENLKLEATDVRLQSIMKLLKKLHTAARRSVSRSRDNQRRCRMKTRVERLANQIRRISLRDDCC